MKIKLNQCLHGYKNGHQLLATSTELSQESNRTLIYQTDLPGSNLPENFKEYISGFPLNSGNKYVLCKTWYAEEMKRPGCVWSHSILIDFADVGKIPEFGILLSLFKRPGINSNTLASYQDIIEVSENILFEPLKKTGQNYSPFRKQIICNLYDKPEKTIVVFAESSSQYESICLDLFSDQWPRLRRQFCFCSGAIGPRILNDKEFDLQVIPISHKRLFEQSFKNIYFLDPNDDKLSCSWVETFDNFSQEQIRQFLWICGSDVKGTRENYRHLIGIFNSVNGNNFDLSVLLHQVAEIFPLGSEANQLKNRLFGEDNMLSSNISEKELVMFLLSQRGDYSLNFKNLDLYNRFSKLVNSNQISPEEFLELWPTLSADEHLYHLLDSIDQDKMPITALVNQSPELVEFFLEKWPSLLLNEGIWQSKLSVQKGALSFLFKTIPKEDIKPYITLILNVQSEAIVECRRAIGSIITSYSLEWLNSNKGIKFISKWNEFIIQHDEKYLFQWLKEHEKSLNETVLEFSLTSIPITKIPHIRFGTETWLKLLNFQKKSRFINDTEISLLVLSIVFSNENKDGYQLIPNVFKTAYSSLSMQKNSINRILWQMIPKETADEFIEYYEDIELPIYAIFMYKIMGVNPEKKRYKKIPITDYSEVLIRILVNKFIKFNWPKQVFIDALDEPKLFVKALEYCDTFKQGHLFLNEIIIESKKYRLMEFQKKILSQY